MEEKAILKTVQGLEFIVPADYERKYCKCRFYTDKDGYFIRAASELGKNKRVRVHREIAEAPFGIFVDHIDRNKSNNLKSNLRFASRSENNKNRGPLKGRKYKGIHKNGDTYQARIAFEGQNFSIGYFKSLMEAVAAYNLFARVLHQEFCAKNYVEDEESYWAAIKKLWDSNKFIEKLSIACAIAANKRNLHG